MSEGNTSSLLSSFNLNKPLEVELVFDESDEEDPSNNKKDNDKLPINLNFDKPVEVSLVIDESDETSSPEIQTHKKDKQLKYNDKHSKSHNRPKKRRKIESAKSNAESSLDGSYEKSRKSKKPKNKSSLQNNNEKEKKIIDTTPEISEPKASLQKKQDNIQNNTSGTPSDLVSKTNHDNNLINNSNSSTGKNFEKPETDHLVIQPPDTFKKVQTEENPNFVIQGSENLMTKDKDSNVQSSLNNEYVDCDNYLTLMLKTVSEHLIVILQAYNCLVSTKVAHPNKINEAENHFQRIKEHFYNLSYSTVANIMLPQEKNTHFVQKFVTDCVALSRNVFNINQFLVLYQDMLEWVKIKKQYISELPFGKTSESLTNSYPMLIEQLRQPLKDPNNTSNFVINKPNEDNLQAPSIIRNPSTCIFSSGPKDREITIKVDPVHLNQQSQNATKAMPPNLTSINAAPNSAVPSQMSDNGNANSEVPIAKPNPNLQRPIASTAYLRQIRPSSRSDLVNRPITNQSTNFSPRGTLQNVSLSHNQMQFVNYNNLPPISTPKAMTAPPPPYHSSVASNSNTHMCGPHCFCNRNLMSHNVHPLQSINYNSPTSHGVHNSVHPNKWYLPSNCNLPSPVARPHTAMSKTQECHNNSSTNQEQVISYNSQSSSQISRPHPPPTYTFNSSVSPQMSPQWQKTKDFEPIEEYVKSTRCHSTDSGFVTPPFNIQSPPAITANQECPNNLPSPVITHVTSLNPKAAYNNAGVCRVCNKTTKLQCLGCHKVYYCSYLCQSKDWSFHEKYCNDTEK